MEEEGKMFWLKHNVREHTRLRELSIEKKKQHSVLKIKGRKLR